MLRWRIKIWKAFEIAFYCLFRRHSIICVTKIRCILPNVRSICIELTLPMENFHTNYRLMQKWSTYERDRDKKWIKSSILNNFQDCPTLSRLFDIVPIKDISQYLLYGGSGLILLYIHICIYVMLLRTQKSKQ